MTADVSMPRQTRQRHLHGRSDGNPPDHRLCGFILARESLQRHHRHLFLHKAQTNIVPHPPFSPDGNVLTFNEKIYDDKGNDIHHGTFCETDRWCATPRPAAPTVMLPATTPDEDFTTSPHRRGDSDGAIAAFTRDRSKDKVAMPVYDHIMRAQPTPIREDRTGKTADLTPAKLKPDDADAVASRRLAVAKAHQEDRGSDRGVGLPNRC
jgi:hypothetical protein